MGHSSSMLFLRNSTHQNDGIRSKLSNRKNVNMDEEVKTIPGKRSLNEMLGDQFMILSVAKTKLDLLNYIKDGYDNNKPILKNNRFLHYVGLILYKSLIIDLSSLFNNDGQNEKNNLHLLISKNSEYKDNLGPDCIEEVQTILSKYRSNNDPVRKIVALRNKEIAHYDLEYSIGDNGELIKQAEERVTIRFNWDHVNVLNELFNIGKTVIEKCGDVLDTDYDWDITDEIQSLDNLLQNAIKMQTKRY